MNNRELTKAEKRWATNLKRCMKVKPSSLVIRQENESGYLMFFDEKTGDRLELEPSIQGFREQDPVDNYKKVLQGS